MVSGYPTFMNIPRVDGLLTDPREMRRHSSNLISNTFLIFFKPIKGDLIQNQAQTFKLSSKPA